MVGAIVLIILCIVLAVQITIWSATLSNLNGMWYAPQEFCEDAGVAHICVFINHLSLTSGGMAYISFADHKGPFINECIPINVYPGQLIVSYTQKKELSISFGEFESDIEEIFPQQQHLIYYPISNKMVWYRLDDDDQMCLVAVLYKQGELSETIEKVNESLDDDE
jgi:hypothetical protein